MSERAVTKAIAEELRFRAYRRVSESSAASGWGHCRDAGASDGCETDLSTATNCGAWGHACSTGTPLCGGSGAAPTCANGCMPSAPTLRGGSCVDEQTSSANCGGRGIACSGHGHVLGFSPAPSRSEAASVVVESSTTKSSSRLLSWLGSLLLCCAATACPPARPNDGHVASPRVDGRAIGVFGGLAGETVVIGSQRTVTDPEGRFSFANVPPTYDVAVLDRDRSAATVYRGLRRRDPLLRMDGTGQGADVGAGEKGVATIEAVVSGGGTDGVRVILRPEAAPVLEMAYVA